MSGRALRRLRQEQFGAGLPLDKDNDDDDDDEEEDSSDDEDDEIGASHQQKRGVFAMMDDSDDSDDDSDDDNDDDESAEKEKEEEPDEEPDEEEDEQIQHDETTKEEQANVARVPDATKTQQQQQQDDDNNQEEEGEEEEEEEDLDAILAEFQSKDQQTTTTTTTKKSANDQNHFCASWMDVLVASLDTRDLDIDYVMRTNLRMGDANANANHNDNNTAARKGRRNATFLFGPPRDGWTRPPHYVGGGIGMMNYNNNNNKESTLDIPWPYSNLPAFCESSCWFKLQHSDTYQKDCLDYHRIIEQSGDVNALALFVTHHPYVTQALLQLSTVLYQTNQNQAGLSVLRRILWIYECCLFQSFLPQSTGCCALVDYHCPTDENKPYFDALFFLLRISHISG